MKLEKIQEAAQASDAYERAKSDLAFYEKCHYFNASGSPTVSAGSSDPMIDMPGPSGQLARDIQAALIKFKTAHVEMAKDSLHRLGVEIS